MTSGDIVRAKRRLLGAACLAAIVGMARAHPVVAAFDRFHVRDQSSTPSLDGGLLLLNELNCVACHAPPAGWQERLPGRGKISLAGVGSRLSPQALDRFIHDPPHFKPGTLMPQVAGRSPESNRALMAYLGSLDSARPAPSFPAGNAARGGMLFASVGCVACHAPADGTTSYPSVPLALAPHYSHAELAAFIRNPLHLRPAGRMPSTELTPEEAADLATFLGAKPRAATTTTRSSADVITAGRAEFQARNCAACHDTGEKFPRRVATPLNQLRSDHGCLASQTPTTAPRFNLSRDQIGAMTAAVRAIQTAASPPAQTAVQAVSARFEQLNCYACHEWRHRGGVEAARAKHFAGHETVVESLGELGRMPPPLNHAGRKLTPEWLEKLLWGTGGGVRPYLTARMPRFGRAASADLIPLLAAACRPDRHLEIDTSGGKGHQRAATGRTLIGSGQGGMGCVTCHGIKDREPQGIRAINLTHTARRLQPEFFKALLLDPQTLQPGTIMPPLFVGRAAAEKEIESIWTYFKELDQTPMLPDGLAVAGSFELKPTEEKHPIVFRTFLEGAGTQAVAVGFPSQISVAFDSYEVRWALAWRGRFLDAQSNWEERPMKPIKPLGGDLQRFPTHLPFAQLNVTSTPWPTAFGRESGYAFKGYRLDAEGVPTFRYNVSGLTIEDTVRPSAEGPTLTRRIVVRGSGEGWYFRGLTLDALPQPVVWQNGTAVFEEMIRF
jgi:mono/diheme cytochrome c family protein